MGTVAIIIIGIDICSFLFLAAYLKRLFAYVKKYRLPESEYTLMFGWMHFSHVIFLYILTVVLFLVATVAFLIFS